MLFHLRIEASSPSYDDAALIARYAHLNGQQIEAADLTEATAKLIALGLNVGHGVGLENATWGYPTSADRGFKIWHLTDGQSRRRLGNNCKIAQLRTPKRAA